MIGRLDWQFNVVLTIFQAEDLTNNFAHDVTGYGECHRRKPPPTSRVSPRWAVGRLRAVHPLAALPHPLAHSRQTDATGHQQALAAPQVHLGGRLTPYHGKTPPRPSGDALSNSALPLPHA